MSERKTAIELTDNHRKMIIECLQAIQAQEEVVGEATEARHVDLLALERLIGKDLPGYIYTKTEYDD